MIRPDVASGARLGPYEIVSRIGAGGMGEVWHGRGTRLDRSIAIKILSAEFAENAQLRMRFEREAKTISQLSHPNICSLFDVGENYLALEHVISKCLEKAPEDRWQSAHDLAEELRWTGADLYLVDSKTGTILAAADVVLAKKARSRNCSRRIRPWRRSGSKELRPARGRRAADVTAVPDRSRDTARREGTDSTHRA